jgi:Zn-dependent alcohol dehydrogenase
LTPGALLNTARVRPGDTVAIIGAGGVGLKAVTAASLAGAAQIESGYQKLADPEVSRVVITRF